MTENSNNAIDSSTISENDIRCLGCDEVIDINGTSCPKCDTPLVLTIKSEVRAKKRINSEIEALEKKIAYCEEGIKKQLSVDSANKTKQPINASKSNKSSLSKLTTILQVSTAILGLLASFMVTVSDMSNAELVSMVMLIGSILIIPSVNEVIRKKIDWISELTILIISFMFITSGLFSFLSYSEKVMAQQNKEQSVEVIQTDETGIKSTKTITPTQS